MRTSCLRRHLDPIFTTSESRMANAEYSEQFVFGVHICDREMMQTCGWVRFRQVRQGINMYLSYTLCLLVPFGAISGEITSKFGENCAQTAAFSPHKHPRTIDAVRRGGHGPSLSCSKRKDVSNCMRDNVIICLRRTRCKSGLAASYTLTNRLLGQ